MAKDKQPKPFKVPLSSPDITDAEREAIAAVLQTTQLSIGPEIEGFEADICDYIGSKHAVGVSSGTAGLHLCVRAAGIGAGDLVVTTPFSFVASSNVMLFENAIPVFVDVDPLTGNIDPNLVRQAVEDLSQGGEAVKAWLPRTGIEEGGALKAILPVDVFGQPADMDPISKAADAQGLKVIEDACEAIGAKYRGRPAGTLGDYGIFAFYPNKQMTTGEGAVIVTDDEEAAALMRSLRNQGRGLGDAWLQHSYLGYNYRLDEMSAALGRVQLSRLEELLAKREQVTSWYGERLTEIPLVETPQVAADTSRMSWFVYVVRLAPEVDRQAIMATLAENGIPSRPYFASIHLQPYMVERFGYQVGDYPVAEDLGRRGLALPFSSVMEEAQVDLVCKELASALAG